MFRQEYPRPQFERNNWCNLNGTWDFSFDDDNIGHKEKWYKSHNYDLKIEVPFCFQSELSGINDSSFHDRVWYHREFQIKDYKQNQRVILHIGACDYESEVYINNHLVKKHVGGFSSFSIDITDYLTFEKEEIVIYAYDPSTSEYILRGKQYWKTQNEGIWYTRTTGLWQTVWLEIVDEIHVDSIRMTPDIDTGMLDVEVNLSKLTDAYLNVKVIDCEEEIVDLNIKVQQLSMKFSLDIFHDKIFNMNTHHQGKTWSPENPYLFDIKFKVYHEEKVYDEVKSYFGMRKIHQKNGLIYLNNRPYYQKLVLDQGYYKNGLLTAPNDDDYVKDIQLAKEMGFNGCRKHQVVSDPRFLYHADRLGFIVWGEMANSANFNTSYVEHMMCEWTQVIKRDYNHPCIVTWVPINESWGIPHVQTSSLEQNHTLAMYHLTHSLDTTRLVISNDGWEMMKTDICGIHNYEHGNENNIEKHKQYELSLLNKESIINSMPANRPIYIDGYNHQGEAIMLTEFGGIFYQVEGNNGWGYTLVNSEDIFLKEYKRLIEAVKKSNCIVGFCYTQLTDVFQEMNGLLTFNRKPKVDTEKIKEINDSIDR